MYVVPTTKAAETFKRHLRTAAQDASLFETEIQGNDFLTRACDAYMRLGRQNPVKDVVILPTRFFDIRSLLSNLPSRDKKEARKKIVNDPTLLFKAWKITVPQDNRKDKGLKPQLTLDKIREAVLYHVKQHDGQTPSAITGTIEAGNPLYDGKRTWKSLDKAISNQYLGLKNTGFKSLSDFCKRDPIIAERTKKRIIAKMKLTLNEVREGVLYHLKHHDSRAPTTRTGIIESTNPLHDGKRTWESIHAAFRYQYLGLNDTGFSSLSDFCKRDEDIQNFIQRHKSARTIFNCATPIQTVVAHPDSTKSQPDKRDQTAIQMVP